MRRLSSAHCPYLVSAHPDWHPGIAVPTNATVWPTVGRAIG
jgi:hypothetical protein